MAAVPLRSEWRPLLAWALSTLFFCYAFVQRVSPSAMVAELMRDFAVGAAILGNLSAFYLYAYAGLQIPVGVLMDRIGPRRLMTSAAVISAGGTLIFAASDVLAGAYIGRLLIGAGAAFSWVGVLTLLAQWFPPARFAVLTGVAQAVGMAGAIFGQAPLSVAVGAAGWRATLVAVATIGFALALLMWLVVRDRPHEAASSVGILRSLRVLLHNRETWLNAVFGMAMTGPTVGFGGLWAVPYLVAAYGFDRAEAAAFTSLIFVGWAIGAPLVGLLSDRMGRRKPVMVASAAVATASLGGLLYLPLSLPAVGALIFIHGFSASSMVLAFACVREHNPPGMSGSAMGFVNTAVVGSGALFQPLIGILLDLNWDGTLVDGARLYAAAAFQTAFGIMPVGCAAGIVAALVMRETFCRQRR